MIEVCEKGANDILAETSNVRKPLPSLGNTGAIQNLTLSDQEWRHS